MNTIFRNFFYAVGFTILVYLYVSDASTAQFSDLVRLAQHPGAGKMVLILTGTFTFVNFLLGDIGRRRAAFSSVESGRAGGAEASDS